MAEWSKAVDLRPTIVKMRGFEPLFMQIFYKINNSNTNFITKFYKSLVGNWLKTYIGTNFSC